MMLNSTMNTFENFLKYGSWTLSIVVALLGIITWIQKQKDRYENKRELRNKKVKK